MDHDQTYFPAVSLYLSRTLDEIGLNYQTVRRRRETFLYCEQVQDVYCYLSGDPCSNYHFGSQTEGATTLGLNSDLDTLICCNAVSVIQDYSEFQEGKMNLLMVKEDTAPGYCRLQLLCSDIPYATDDVPSEDFERDRRGRVVLKNTSLDKTIPGLPHTRNGPARTESGRPGVVIDNDKVLALKCCSWPEQARGFKRRHSRHGWPSQDLIQQATRHGVFLVPVGYKLSRNEHLEWRISASLAERYLMFSLSIVHIKCYVLLKMLVKTYVDPHVEKCISSYHCKTALLHCSENTEPGFWREDNLLQCVTRCLSLLRTWVGDGFCPQFIMNEENLFAGKVNADNQDTLKGIFTDLVRSKGRAVLLIPTDNIGKRLQSKLSMTPTTLPIHDTEETITLMGKIEFDKQACVALFQNFLMFMKKDEDPCSVIQFVQKKMGHLELRIRYGDKRKKDVHSRFVGLLSCWFGALLASLALSRKNAIPRVAKCLLRNGTRTDAASTLKLASVLYCNGEFRKVEILLESLEKLLSRDDMLHLCRCYDRKNEIPFEFCQKMRALKDKKARAKLAVTCVRFTPHERECIPAALRIELNRSAVDDVRERHVVLDRWMDLATVDSLPYLYFLQCVNFRKLGKHEQQKRAMYSLDRCIRESNNFSHLETAWNLLGHCMELDGKQLAARACYRTSLEIRPRNNAASWHLRSLQHPIV